MNQLLDGFKALSDQTRLRLFRTLALADEPLCVCELVDVVRRPEYAVSRALRVLRTAGLVEEERRGKLMFYAIGSAIPKEFREIVLRPETSRDDSVALDADRLRWRLDLRKEGQCVVTYTAGYNPPEYTTVERKSGKPRVLFICVHNSARSQISEEYLRRYADDLFDVESAGLEAGTLNPYVVEVLKEDGIDISGKETRKVWNLYRSGKAYAYVITVCSREAERNCPVFPGPVNRISWPFPDPSAYEGTREEILAKTRKLRDTIRDRVGSFVEEYRRNQNEPKQQE